MDDGHAPDRGHADVRAASPGLLDLRPDARRDGRRPGARHPARLDLRDPVGSRRMGRRRRAMGDARVDQRPGVRRAARGSRRADPRDRPVHRHRRLDGHPAAGGRRGMAGHAGDPQPAAARRPQPVPRARDRHDRGRVPRGLRRRHPRRPMWPRDDALRTAGGPRDPGRPAHGRGRDGGAQRSGRRRPRSRAGDVVRHGERGACLLDDQGPPRGLRADPRGCRHA